jgi:hypothetical protein
MSLLVIKLIVTPLVVLLASLAARRWGEAVAGWLVGLPLTSAPVSAFLAIEQGPSFAAQAADGTLAGVVSQAAFCLGYAALARLGATAALAAGTLAYAATAATLIAAGLPSAVLCAAAVAALTLVLWLLPSRLVDVSAKAAVWWDLPLRTAVTTALVVGLTSAATTLGPGASGAMAAFPLIGALFARLRPMGPGRPRGHGGAARDGERALRRRRVLRHRRRGAAATVASGRFRPGGRRRPDRAGRDVHARSATGKNGRRGRGGPAASSLRRG